MHKIAAYLVFISSLSFAMEDKEKYYIDYMVTSDNGAEERDILWQRQSVPAVLDYLQDSRNSLLSVNLLRIYTVSDMLQDVSEPLELNLDKIVEKGGEKGNWSVPETIQKIKQQTEKNLSLDQTVMPCADKKKTYYVDYVVRMVLSTTSTQDFLSVRQTVKQTLDHLNECSFGDGRPNNLFVSLLRIYEDPKQTLHLCDEQSHETIKEALLKLGAEEGAWDCTQAMNKIKQQIGME